MHFPLDIIVLLGVLLCLLITFLATNVDYDDWYDRHHTIEQRAERKRRQLQKKKYEEYKGYIIEAENDIVTAMANGADNASLRCWGTSDKKMKEYALILVGYFSQKGYRVKLIDNGSDSNISCIVDWSMEPDDVFYKDERIWKG